MTKDKKTTTSDESVETSISKDTLKIAKEELREDSNARETGLLQMREWIKKNPRIESCRMDASFLLRFLRSKKFSVPMAQEALERYILLRTTYGDLAFSKLDPKEPKINDLLDLGYLFAVPKRDKLGRRVIIARPGKIIVFSSFLKHPLTNKNEYDQPLNSKKNPYFYRIFVESGADPGVFDPYKFTNGHMLQIHGMTYETLMEDEENQVRGFVHFNDGAGVTFPHMTIFTPKEAVRIVKNGEKTLPMRHKEVHIINVPGGLKYALDFGFSLVSEKIRKRMAIYSNIEEAHEYIDKKILPKEYGGVMPMAEMIKLWKEELYNNTWILRKNDTMRVRPEMFSVGQREGSVRALKGACGRLDQDLMAGSFRKLTVD